MEYPAHIRVLEDGTKRTQLVIDHCRKTAEYAKSCLVPIRAGNAAYLAGLFHDMGKCTEASRRYQEAAAAGDMVHPGSVIHTFQGCRFLLEGHNETPEESLDVTREVLAYAASAHHGLFDCYNEKKKSGFFHRIAAPDVDYEEARTNFLQLLDGDAEADNLLQAAQKELSLIYDKLEMLSEQNQDLQGTEFMFCLGLLSRLLLSSVIEGDRRDSAEFLTDAEFEDQPEDMRPIWRTRLTHLEKKLLEFPSDAPIQLARKKISEQCRSGGKNEAGIYRLNVPTGAGKTLGALRFALAHAAKWNKRRILFTAPLLTILEQNAEVLRDFIGDDAIVLEHHSNVLRENRAGDQLDHRELLIENWNAPVIITSMVQLLNTMFDGKTSSIRRFWALADSIIVIDEVQTVPSNMLTLFNLTVNFLTEICGAAVVLCSATQPCLERANHPLFKTPTDIVPFDPALWQVFSRTKILPTNARILEEIQEFILQVLDDAESLLVVCNKKSEAEYLFRQVSQQHHPVFHLSAAMCMAHRRQTLKELEQALKESRHGGPKALCISTQVIEAGVDISFGQVIRLTAGIDSIIQSAGRCNRNREQPEPAPVYVLTCADETLRGLREIQMGKTATTELLESYRQNPKRFHNELTSDEAVSFFYQRLYQNMSEGYQDFFPPKKRASLFSLLSDNAAYANIGSECYGRYCLNQAFQTAGILFQVFDEETETVVVPFGEGEELIAELSAEGEHPEPRFLTDWLKRVKPYTVSIYEYQKKALSYGGLYSISDILVLQPSHYDEKVGLVLAPGELDFLEV